MRTLLPFLLVFPLMADEMAISVDEAFPDPYAPYYDDDCDDSERYLYQCYDGDVGEAWLWDEPQKYPGRNTDEFMEELTEPWR